jgi:hypothetical protein
MTTETTTPVEEKLLPEMSDDAVRRFADAQIKNVAKQMLHDERKKKQKRVKKAFALWVAQARSAMDQILSTAGAMVARIKSDPGCVLAGMFADTDLQRLDRFEGALSDPSTILNDVYPLIGKQLVDPLDVMEE